MRTREIIRSAWRSLWAHRFQTGLTMAVLAVGIAVLVDVLAVCEGAYQQNVRDLSQHGDNYCDLYIRYRKGRVMRWLRSADLAYAVHHSPSVVSATPVLSWGGGTVRLGAKRARTDMMGVEPRYFPLRHLQMAQGRYFTNAEGLGRRPVLVLGAGAADQLALNQGLLGQRVVLSSYGGRRLLARVIGVAARTEDQEMDNSVYVPLTLLQELVGLQAANALFATTWELERTPGLQQELQTALASRNVYVEGHNQLFLVLDRSAGMRQFGRVIFLCGLGLGLINALVVAKVLVSASIERRQEVGLRKALGARSREILWQHLLEPALAVGAGLLLGMLVGAAVIPIMGLVMSWAPVVPWSQVSSLAAFTWVLAGVASATPAWQASQLDPARMLRAA